MNKLFRGFGLVSLALLVTLAASPVTAKIIDRIVARVNDEIITYYDVKQSAVPFLLQNGRDPSVLQDPARREAVYRETLDDLVDRKLLVQEAKELELKIKDKELDQWLQFTRQQQNMTREQFAQMIEQYGMSYDIYREMVRQNLLKIRMIKIKVGSQITITEKEVLDAYRERYGEGGATERYLDVAHILIRPRAESVDAEEAARGKAERLRRRVVEGGEDFATVAKDASEGPNAKKGGQLGSFRRGDLDPEFEEAAFELEEGEISPVVRTKFGYHVIKVLGIREKQSPDADERKAKIRAELQQEQMQRLLDRYLEGLRNKAFVEVRWER